MRQIVYNFGASRAETTSYQAVEGPCTLKRLDGYCNGANTSLMLFDLVTAPANNAVPKKSLQVFGNDGFSYVFNGEDEVEFINGVWIATSTSEVNYVADAANKVSGDITVKTNFDATAFTSSGDYTTGIANSNVWTVASGYHRIRRVWIKNNNAAAVIAGLAARNTITSSVTGLVNFTPLINGVAPIASGLTYVWDFGSGMYIPKETVGATDFYGCTIGFALLPTTGNPTVGLWPTQIATADFNMKMWYTT
jgi:hypothetical protein